MKAPNGNQISDLLRPRKVTIPLMMGVAVSSPKATIANDKIPKFNFIHAMAADMNEQPDRPIFLEYNRDIGKESEPDEPEGQQQWDKVKGAWGSDDARTTSQRVLDIWKVVFKWSNRGNIAAVPPKHAVKKFKTVYMAAPLMCREWGPITTGEDDDSYEGVMNEEGENEAGGKDGEGDEGENGRG
jgi:hypothetical protein